MAERKFNFQFDVDMLEEAWRLILVRKKRPRPSTSSDTSPSPKMAQAESLKMESFEAGSSSQAPERHCEEVVMMLPPATMMPVTEVPTMDVREMMVVVADVLVADVPVTDTLEAMVAAMVVLVAEMPTMKMLAIITESTSAADKLPEEVVKKTTPAASLLKVVIITDPLPDPLQEMCSDRGSDNIPPPPLPQVLILAPIFNLPVVVLLMVMVIPSTANLSAGGGSSFPAFDFRSLFKSPPHLPFSIGSMATPLGGGTPVMLSLVENIS